MGSHQYALTAPWTSTCARSSDSPIGSTSAWSTSRTGSVASVETRHRTERGWQSTTTTAAARGRRLVGNASGGSCVNAATAHWASSTTIPKRSPRPERTFWPREPSRMTDPRFPAEPCVSTAGLRQAPARGIADPDRTVGRRRRCRPRSCSPGCRARRPDVPMRLRRGRKVRMRLALALYSALDVNLSFPLGLEDAVGSHAGHHPSRRNAKCPANATEPR